MKIKTKVLIFLLLGVLHVQGQNEINVLFLGNSYTAVNNLPEITAQLLKSTDKTLRYKAITPGGCTLVQHSENESNLELIRSGEFDYVVLQEQSQLPTIEYYRESLMNPAYKSLCDTIYKYNPCCMVVGYMTWGRQKGGQQCEDFGDGIYCSPPFRNFSEMQESLSFAYCQNAYANKTYVAPVGNAWKKILDETTITLHSSDYSHPNYNGSYLAACVFHAMFWNESPVGMYFNSQQIDESVARTLQQAAHEVVFGTPETWNINIDSVNADFEYTIDKNIISCTNKSTSNYAMTYHWDFGDGTTYNTENSTHTYLNDGEYIITLISSNCRKSDTITMEIVIDTDGLKNVDNDHFKIINNPYDNLITIEITPCQPYSVKIFNIDGKLVAKHKKTCKNRVTLSTKDKSGVFIVHINESGRTFSRKILKR